MAATIKCEICGKSFRAVGKRANTARFCSNACRGEWLSTQRGPNAPHWKGGKVTLVCEYCGDSYQRGVTLAAESRFCSRQCQDAWKSRHLRGPEHPSWGQIPLVCQQCRQTFWVAAWRLSAKFCNMHCYRAWLEEHHPRKTFTCKICGRIFQRQPNQAVTAQFCSRKCLALSRTGPKAANWKGGKSFEPYPTTFNSEFKHGVRERDDHRCAICWMPGACVHHIDYDKENTAMANCITLCTACHGTTNAHRGYWQDTLSPMATTRNQNRDGGPRLAPVILSTGA